jgi:Flp pilus assembly protein TadG
MLISRLTASKLAGFLRRFRAGKAGNIAMTAALVSPVLLGTFGLGTEVTSWYSIQRKMQNAADSAASAAATNGSDSFGDEARAVSARYGFFDGKNGVVVTALDNQTCPDGTTTCYLVTVKKPVALALAKVVGYGGDAMIGQSPAKLLTASAMAVQDMSPRPYCVLALGTSGAPQAIRTNGNNSANMTGCNVMSNTGANCNGHDLLADVGDSHGYNDGCGVKRNSNVPVVADKYAARASGIPSFNCPFGFPQAPKKNGDKPLPAINEFSGAYTWPTTPQVCGDMRLTGDTIINTDANGAVLFIRNGNLDLNGYKLQTSSGSALTIVFTGEDGPNYGHSLVGAGVIDVRAPSKGFWSGVAVYQNPSLTQNVDVYDAGNSPAWAITGLVYMPHASVTLKGAVNKSSFGASCFTLVVDNLLISGTGNILAHGQCGLAGLNMPTNPVPTRGKLVS